MGIEVVDVLVNGVRLGRVALKIECSPVPVGILVHDVAELVQEKIGRARTAHETSPPELGARLKPREEDFACSSGGGTYDGLRGLDLAWGQAVGAIRTLTLQFSEIDVTAFWVLDQTVLQSIISIAGVENGTMNHWVLVRGDVGGGVFEGLNSEPERPGVAADISWVARNDAVELVRVSVGL